MTRRVVSVHAEEPVLWERFQLYRAIGEDIKHISRYSNPEYDYEPEMDENPSLDIMELDSRDYDGTGTGGLTITINISGWEEEYDDDDRTLDEDITELVEDGYKVIRLEDQYYPRSPLRSAGIYIIRGWNGRRPIGAYIGETISFNRRISTHYYYPDEGGYTLMNTKRPTISFVRIPSSRKHKAEREAMRARYEKHLIARHADCGVLTNRALPSRRSPRCRPCPLAEPALLTEQAIAEWLPSG